MSRRRGFAVMILVSVLVACDRSESPPSEDAASTTGPVITESAPQPNQAEPVPVSPQRAEVERLVSDGSVVMKDIVRQYPNTEPCIGDGSWFLMVGLPEQVWSKLTPGERVALSYYVESRIPFARESPARYMITPSDAPLYSQFAAGVRRDLCDTCWTIVTGSYTRDGGVSPERALLNGDGCTTCWGKAQAASDLRQKTLGHEAEPVTWKMGEPDGEPSCAGYVQRR